MKCPDCTNPLITLEFDRIEVDYCTECQGVWLDSGELEYLLSLEGHNDPYMKTMKPLQYKEKKKSCPICSRSMDKISIGDTDMILLDNCSSHGLWFDRGELQKILSLSGKKAETQTSSLVRMLDEMFAHKTE